MISLNNTHTIYVPANITSDNTLSFYSPLLQRLSIPLALPISFSTLNNPNSIPVGTLTLHPTPIVHNTSNHLLMKDTATLLDLRGLFTN